MADPETTALLFLSGRNLKSAYILSFICVF